SKHKDVMVDVEHNYLAQAAVLASAFANVEIKKHILKYTGRPIYSDELKNAVMRILKGSEKEVLEYGA
ncbi:MAG: 2-oxoacid:ferredoxin oxidoreductase subunit alpha, partial [Nitrososphaeria archaeon]